MRLQLLRKKPFWPPLHKPKKTMKWWFLYLPAWPFSPTLNSSPPARYYEQWVSPAGRKRRPAGIL